MAQKNLLLLALKQICEFPFSRESENRFVMPELGFVRSVEGMNEMAQSILVVGKPYRLTEGRVVYIRSGCIHIRVNLREVTVQANQLIVGSPGTVIEMLDMPGDVDMMMLAFADSLMEGWQKEPLLQAYLQGGLFFAVDLSNKECTRLENFFGLFWDVLHDEPFPRDTVRSLVSVLFRQIEAFYHREAAVWKHKHTRQEEVFNRFLKLVNKYAVGERNIAFYASALYLSPRYLSTLIKQTSGRTVMDWVNAAVVQETKLQLRHTDKLVYQIADELHFPNASFFCKFFRRMTGKTPHEYRSEE